MFVTKYQFVVPEGTRMSDKLFVERAGYIPAKRQIENLIYSGQRLVMYRQSEFGGFTDEEAEADYTGIDSCSDLVDVNNCVRQYEERKAASNSHPDVDDDNGVNSNGAELPVENS